MRCAIRAALILLIALAAGCQPPKERPKDSPPEPGDSDSVPVVDSPGGETGETAETGETGETGTPEEGPFALSVPPRNLLIISIDTLRRDAVGSITGGEATPFLDSLAAEGVLLTHHRSCSSWTYPGSICAMTGLEPQDIGFIPTVPELETDLPRVPETTATLASTLAAAGFTTSLVTSNLYLGYGSGLATGYDTLLGTSGLPADAINSLAEKAFDTDTSTDVPWLVHVHYVDPHAPYNAPESYLGGLDGLPTLEWDLSTEEGLSTLSAVWTTLSPEVQAQAVAELDVRYAAEVRFVDDQIKALFEALDAAGRLDDTLVMFWNDHGEQLFEHGARGHAISLFGEETDGFALFWARGLSPAVWDEATTNLDLMPTALWLLDIDPPPGLAGDVVGTAPAERPVFGTVAPIGRPPQQSVTVGNRKLIYRWDGLKSLFLRDTDPAEANNVYDDNPAVVQAMWDLLLPEVERAEPFIADYTPESPGP